MTQSNPRGDGRTTEELVKEAMGWQEDKDYSGLFVQTYGVDETLKNLVALVDAERTKLKEFVEKIKPYRRHLIGYSCGFSAINGEVCHCGLKELLNETA